MEEDPEQQLRRYADALAAAIEQAVPGWVVRSVERLVGAWSGTVPQEAKAAARDAAEQAQAQVGPAVRQLLQSDVDEQRTTPLTLLREAVSYPTAVIREAGVPAVERDEFAQKAFPADMYDLSPATLADVDQSLAEPGLAWGAAKAFVHKRRHGR